MDLYYMSLFRVTGLFQRFQRASFLECQLQGTLLQDYELIRQDSSEKDKLILQIKDLSKKVGFRLVEPN